MRLFKTAVPPVPTEPRPIPEIKANIFNKIVFQWITPVLTTGYRRPLEMGDLYVLQDRQLTKNMTDRFDTFWQQERGKEKPSLLRALNGVFGFRFWSAGIFRVISDTLQITAPLLLAKILTFLAQSRTDNPPPVGYGFMYCIILYAMQVISSLCGHQFMQLSMITGFSARTVLLTSLYRKSLVLSGKARMNYTAGKIVNLMSTDTTRIDFVAGFFHIIWAAPLMISIGLVELIVNLGVAGLAGFGVMIIFGPLQTKVMRSLAKLRRKAIVVTDSRVKLTQEMLQGIRVIKFYAWEDSFTQQLNELRTKELGFLRLLLIVRAGVNGVAQTVPILASVLSFITYSLIGNPLNPAIIFSSLTVFNIVRLPLMLLPMVIGATVDAQVSVQRIEELLLGEELDPLPPVNYDAEYGLRITDGDFVWETAAPAEEKKEKKGLLKKLLGGKDKKDNKTKQIGGDNLTEKGGVNNAKEKEDDASQNTIIGTSGAVDPEKAAQHLPTTVEPDVERPFLRNININIERGSLTAIVGSVGAGKSSLLNALVGEMKQIRGEIEFGGNVGYCPQTAWIQNATLKDNILFGLPYDEEKYHRVIRDCALVHDLEILPDGDMTEIGERGINLSGGQKQRINLARAYYFNADILLLDDPLSAVDAHVGKHLLEKCIMTALAGKTRVLVTHQLHVLPRVDYIIVMKNGEVAERGTYNELMSANQEFAKLMAEYGGAEEVVEDKDKIEVAPKKGEEKQVAGPLGTGIPSKGLMTQEERATGAVSGKIYKYYISNAGGIFVVPLLILLLACVQAANIGTSQWLALWSEDSYNFSTGFWMAIYAGFGLTQAFFNFSLAFTFSVTGIIAAKALHAKTVASIFRAPMAFFDTTPIGRIMNRFSKDVDAADNLLSDSYRQFLYTFFAATSTFILISIFFPVFLAPLSVLLVGYGFTAVYYRSTSRELKRLDSLLRSTVYAHFSETLSGLATIRAYREQTRFIKNNENLTDSQNRAYYLSITIQRWLGIRLEAVANTLIFFVTLFSIIYRYQIDPATIGFVLSYSLSVTGVLNWVVRQFAEVENNMNSVERLWYYTEEIEREAPSILPENRPADNWPVNGEIKMENVSVRYREGLPNVLHGISLTIKGGEKIGVVGRTGSGKSTIMIALFRLVELSGGKITIDGVDVSKIGLRDLRSKLAIIPQDPVIFHGTIRGNLDPFRKHTDQELWDVLERSDLKDYVVGCKGALDSEIAEGGENLSVGQRQLLCLARAMLTGAKIIVMDEATASVDVKTDALLQKALRVDFGNCTLLTIAHRLNTIIDYDRVLVLDNGNIKEFDSPSNLLANPNSAFSAMVNETGQANAELLRGLAKRAIEGRLTIDIIEKLVQGETVLENVTNDIAINDEEVSTEVVPVQYEVVEIDAEEVTKDEEPRI